VALQHGPEARSALLSLHAGALDRGETEEALAAVDRLEEGGLLWPEEGPLLRLQALGPGPGEPLRGPGVPDALRLARALHPPRARALPLPEHREAAERLAASGEMPATAMRVLEALAGREIREGAYCEASEHLRLLLELGPEPGQRARLRDLLDLAGHLEGDAAGPPAR
jgi:hypothetical protein